MAVFHVEPLDHTEVFGIGRLVFRAADPNLGLAPGEPAQNAPEVPGIELGGQIIKTEKGPKALFGHEFLGLGQKCG